jgi:hypothetical protein
MKVLTRLLIGCLIGLLAMVEARSASAFPRFFRARTAQAAPVVATSGQQVQNQQAQSDKGQPSQSIAGQGAQKDAAPQAAKDEGQPSKDATAAGSDSKSGAQRVRTARWGRLFGRRRAA